MATASTKRARFFERFVDDRVVMSVIVLNALVLFLRAFEQWEHTRLLFALDYACTVYFVVELALKIGLRGLKPFLRGGWNKFDFVIILAASPHLLAPFMETKDFALLLILRTVRLVRALRLMHFIPDRDRLWHGLVRALRASLGVILALVVYNFVLGLTACYLFRHTGSPHFADPLSSMYAIFKVFTVEGWYEIPDSVAGTAPAVGTYVRAFFAFAVLSGGILGLSLANAVFVDEMVLDNTDEVEQLINDLRAELAQANRSTHADLDRLERAVTALSEKLDRARGSPEDS